MISPEREMIQALMESATGARLHYSYVRPGGLKDDLPRMVEALRQSHPHLPICMETALGDVPEVLEAISAWILDRVD